MSGREGEWECVECNKKYNNYSSYYVHMRNKHKEENKIRDSSNYKAKFTEQQLNDLEDKIYVFLGELGDNNPEGADRNQNQSITEDANRFAGQANYLANLVVRTPYESQINVLEEVPTLQKRQGYTAIGKNFEEQVLRLFAKLSDQKQTWEFMDPLDNEQDPENEFSLMDIPKLLRNLSKRQIELKFPEFTVFVLWLSRVCKPEAWKQIYELVAYCCYDFYDYLEKNNYPKTIAHWNNYFPMRTVETLNNYEFNNNATSITNASWEKLLQFYYKWVEYFGVLPRKQKQQASKQAIKEPKADLKYSPSNN